ncbi:HAD family hydrolase [Paenibacillus kribbensis]|uniref:HAD family hydrolase n=1 Tax=Paenibacillus kribbensis TaxID=172713 RepID=UPI002DBB4141|nr:HAD family hydrolase [Paenibacillus kribbensis]MEC0235948.1 HAD family hydrolase [Paenibacillus kribbensis]
MSYPKQHILFDLDDTLVHCNKYFDLILSHFFDLLQEWFAAHNLTKNTIREKQIEIDVAGVHQLGFASEHFPQSLIDTYRFFSEQFGRRIDSRDEQELRSLGRSVYEQEIEPYPGMVETLNSLQKAGHSLYLYTGGEQIIQERKIEQMKLANYFDERIYIRQHKNVEALEEIIQMNRLDRGITWMIGNSLRTDVSPALAAGIHAVYLKQPKEWIYNMVELQKNVNSVMYTIQKLTEVPKVIHESIQLHQQKRTLG